MNEQRFRLAKHFIIVSIALIGLIYCLIVMPGSRRFAASSADATRSVSAKPDQQIAGTPLMAGQDGARSRGAWADSWVAQNRGRGILLPAVRARAAAAATRFLSPAAPILTATKTYMPAGNANPGDTLTYSIVISNTGMADATGVNLMDMIDPNTALVPGSVIASPIAVDDTFNTIGNVNIQIPLAQGVINNDFDPNTGNQTALTVSQVNATNILAGGTTVATTHGSVTMFPDGHFNYTPAVAYRGPSDSFTYTLANGTGKTDTATVTININGLIWFINSAAASNGDGRLNSPFKDLVGAGFFDPAAADAANDIIFVYSGNYTGGLTLLNGQKLIGQGAGDTLLNLAAQPAPSGPNLLPATGGANPIIAAAVNNITLGTGNTIRGVTLNVTAVGATALLGTSFGTLTLAETTIGGTNGRALSLTTGTLTGPVASTAAFTSISSTNSSTTGITLTGIGGNMSSGSTTVTNSTGIGISVDTSSAVFNFNATSSTGSGGAGVSLTTNTGAITFGAITITPDPSGRGLLATENTQTITIPSGTVTTSGATAIEITRSSSTTPLLISLASVTANGGTNGIKLLRTSGSFTVTGDGASDPANTTRGRTTAKQGGGTITLGSGGTINNTTGAAVSLDTTTNVTLRNLSLTGNSGGVNSGADGINAANSSSLILDNLLVTGHLGNDGLFGSAVSALTLQHMDIHTNAKTSGVESSDIWDVRLDNLTGTCSVANSLFFDAREDIFTITNGGSSNLTLTVTNSEFRDTDLGSAPAVGDAAFQMLASGSAVTTLTATGCTFKNVRLTGFHYAGNNTSSGTVKVMNSAFGGASNDQNGVDIDIDHQGQGTTLNFEVSGNTTRQGFRAFTSTSINIFLAGLSTAASQMIGTVKNNVVGIAGTANSGSDLGAGIALDCTGAGTMTATVTGNTVNQVKANSGNVFDAGTSQTSKLNLKIRNNTFNGNPAQVNPQYGIHINAGTGTPGETNQLCIDMGANSVAMPASAIASVDLDSFPGTTTQLVGYTGAANNGTQIQNFFGSNPGTTPPGANTSTTPATLYTAAGGTTQGAVAPCSTFAFPASLDPELSAQSVDTVTSDANADSSTQSDSALRATWGEALKDSSVHKLTSVELNWIVQAAIERWRQTGIAAEDLARLQSVTFDIADLPDGQLANAAALHVNIDESAAGYGWFFDQSPMDDSEFDVSVPGKERQTTDFSPAHGKMDLLTVVMRELGQVYLQGKTRTPKQLRPLMRSTLSPSVRRMPIFNLLDRSTSSLGLGEDQSLNGSLFAPWQPETEYSILPSFFRPAVFNPSAEWLTGSYGSSAKPMSYAASAKPVSYATRARRVAYTPAPSGETVNKPLFTIPPGKSVTVMFQATINALNTLPVGTNQVCNQGTVTANGGISVLTDDPSKPGATDQTCTTLNVADLAVTKSDAPDPVIAGSNITYTIGLTNNGPVAASTVTVTDAVPANTTLVSATFPAGWSRSDSVPVGGTGNIVFAKASVANAETATFTIVVKVTDTTAHNTVINNSATAASTTADTTPANNTASTTTTVTGKADLTLSKSAPATVNAGSDLTYTINFSNAGPGTAVNVAVTDAVPAGTTFVSASVTSGTGWAVNTAGPIVFSKASVPSGETATFQIVVNVPGATAGGTIIHNSVSATADTSDPTPATATADTTVIAQADLALTKTGSPTPDVIAGNNITYTIGLTNNGPAAATSVSVTDPTPANTTLVSVTTPAGWSRTDAVPAGGTGTITFTKASVANAETATFTIVVKVNSSTANGATITNTATVTSTTTDPTSGNNSATAMTNVIRRIDLAVTKTDAPDPVIAGNNITYTINFVNNGPSDASTVTVTDTLPAGTGLVSAVVTTGAGWATTTPAGQVVFSKAAVTAGETAVFTIVVSVPASTASGATINNSVTAAATETDTDNSNNTATASTSVITRADLVVTKSDSPDPVSAGANLTYTINFNNAGPSDAQTVTVSDAVPAGTTLVSAMVTTGMGWAVNTAGPIVFSKATVAAGESAVFTIVVSVPASTASGTVINNSATASSATTDPTPGNNTGTAMTTVQTSADLAVTKSDSPDPSFAGANITYTIGLTNNGPSDAQSVTMSDPTPTNTTLVSVTTPAGWSRTDAVPAGGTGTITFTKATVANAETATFTIVVKVDAATPTGTTITNTATASSTTTDPTPGNNSATATTSIQAQADLAITKTASPTPTVIAGNNITYTINLINNGPGAATSVSVTDPTPTNTTLVSVTTPAGWSRTDAVPAGGTGTITFTKASVANAETATFTIVVKVNSSTANGATITNTATVTSGTGDPTPGNNMDVAMTNVIRRIDLAVTKTDSPDPVIAGNNITYTINFVNNGPSDASTVTVTDTLPAGTGLVSAVVTTGAGWATTTPAGQVVFSKAAVTAGETAVFTIVVSVPASTASGATINNSVTAAATETDTDNSNNTATASTSVITRADLVVTKSDSPDPVSAGANLTYTINFNNAGPSDAQTVTVSDAVPAGTTFVSAMVTTGMGWAVNTAGPIVFSKATVAAGESAVFTIVVSVPASTASGTVINNSATASSATTDPTPGNNTGTAMTTVQTSADLAVTKSDSPDPVSAGGNITYTINFVNNGPSDAQTVTVTDAVPANTTFVSATVTTGTGWAVNTAGPIVFSKATVAAGETAVFTMVVKVNSNVASGTVISNSAVAASTTTDPTPGNNTGTATTTVQVMADLAITKTDSPDPVIAGNNITYTINLTNNGPSDASTVSVSDAVPANTTFVSAMVISGSGWAVNTAGPIVFSKATVLNAETATFQIIVKVNANVASGTTITNTASVTATSSDGTPANNSATATTTVQTQADLAVTKSDSPDPVTAGNNLTYTINFVNNGPSDAQTVTVTDAVPANTTFVSATVTTGTGWAVNTAGPVVFSKGTVAAGETAVFTMVVKVNANAANSSTISNSATAASATTDPTPGNNTGTATTTVQTRADLAVTKSDSPDPVNAGANLTYTINFSNAGPSDAQTVTVTDAVPANTTFVSATVTTGTGWAVNTAGPVVFSKGTVAAGETAVFTMVVKVNSNTANGTTINNSAVAASTTTDPTPGNNTGTAATTVQVQADLAVTKSDSPDPVVASQNLTYTINFVNNGPSDAQTVTVTDAVPANTTFVSATVTTGSGWSKTQPAVGAGSGNVQFSKATVTAGETAVFTIVVNVNAGTANNTIITNSATAASTTPDPTPGNNTGTATTTVIAQADLAVTKSDSPDPVCVNGNITYTINFINNGPGPGLNTTVSDPVPANTTFVSATVTTGTGWSVNTSGPIVFSKANVAAGETAVFTMVVKVNAGTTHGTVISNTVTAMSSIPDPTPSNNSATTTTTVDPIPPVITCPANITAVAALTCPASNTANVTFAPTVTDNCAATVICVPPSGSAFPVGTTTVTCTATDTAGNTASCSFTVRVWTGCLQDDSNPGNVVLFDAQTGEYRFCCNGAVVATGTGTVKVAGCVVTINHLKHDRRVQLSAELQAKRGTATIIISNETTCQITDRNTLNNTCLCP